MGRSKLNTAQQSGTSIPLPHDGPIFHHQQRQRDEQAATEDDDDDDYSLQAALRLLKDTSSPLSSSSSSSSATKLCHTLQNASNAKEQIHALQMYRSNILNLKKNKKKNKNKQSKELMDGDDDSTLLETDVEKEEYNNNNNNNCGLYRLLLEWSLSHQTPVPLQRTILSVLTCIEMDDDDDNNNKNNTPREMISIKVLQSIIILSKKAEKQQHADDYYNWKNPLRALDVAAHDITLAEILKTTTTTGLSNACLSFLCHKYISPSLLIAGQQQQQHDDNGGGDDNVNVKESIILSKILKILLNNNNNKTPSSSSSLASADHLEELQKYVLMLFGSSKIPTDSYNTLGIIYGNLLFEKVDQTIFNGSSGIIVSTVESLDTVHANLSSLARLSMIQGIAATLDLQTLTTTTTATTTTTTTSGTSLSTSPLESCWKYSLHISRVATDPMVRWGALKGLSTLAVRWSKGSGNVLSVSSASSLSTMIDPATTSALIQETLQVVLQTWENPPLRKLAKAIPGLFQTLVQLLDKEQTQQLCQDVLEQPANRKGKYLALDILLPQIMPSDMEAIMRPESLLEGIGDRGPNTSAIADLWTKILQLFWTRAIENDNNNNNNNNNNTNTNNNNKKDSSDGDQSLFDEWTLHWVPSLASVLVSPDLSRRKQIAMFCIPRVVDLMKRIKTLRNDITKVFVALFNEIEQIRGRDSGRKTLLEAGESLSDRALWAHLELARHTTLNKLSSQDIRDSIAKYLPADILRVALTHSASSVRLVAFQSLEAIVVSYSKSIEFEIEMWKYAFPYAVKTTDNKDYTSSLLQYLSSFLDRLLSWEAGVYQKSPSSSSSEMLSDSRNVKLPQSFSFVSEFLIRDVAVSKGAYPGTIADKEGFTLQLLGCLLAFVTQDQFYTDDLSVGRNDILFKRRRDSVEVMTMNAAMDDLLSLETFAALFGLLHSIWDNTRETAFRSLAKLILAAQANDKQLPVDFSSNEARTFWKARAIHLASSPRQREADTGARILAFLYASLSSEDARGRFLEELVELLQTRLEAMKVSLESVLKTDSIGEKSDGGNCSTDGSDLPLAHGLIQSVRLSIEHRNTLQKRQNAATASVAHNALYERMIGVFCQAIQVSLAVVADVREGETLQGVEDEVLIGRAKENKGVSGESATPLNVNTGAIGANGAFSKLEEVDEHEMKGRIALQRVVIGTWLLTKEACGAVSFAIAISHSTVSTALVSKVGTLLITTLTSLKHAGAAFAARDALQAISTACLSSDEGCTLRTLPNLWIDRLLDEISTNEKVRDSTLRRSTGYALGFTALMRSEVASNTSPRTICSRVLQDILMYAVPPEQEIAGSFAKLNLCSRNAFDSSEFFFVRSGLAPKSFVLAEDYQVRCRVHALNILRLVVLDAPLSVAVQPFVGDAILSAILGYDDLKWAVRNSATMVFSAAMLRVVDSDKNASNTDTTSSNAITITELFRRYPPLAPVLLATMRKALADPSEMDGTDSLAFPALLLLSRVAPVSTSGELASSLIEKFPPVVCKSLASRNLTVRAAAARALANICTDNQNTASSAIALISHMKTLIESGLSPPCDWNVVDGALLGVFALISSSKSSRVAYNDIQMDHVLLRVLVSKERKQICPPSCMATALESVIAMFHENESSLDEAHISSICRHITRRHSLENMIGGAKALSTAAVTFCELLQRHLWDPVDAQRLAGTIDDMEALLSSNLIDVRLAAVKSFKKHVYKNIDNLLEVTGSDVYRAPSRIEITSSIARMLLRCTHAEMTRQDLMGKKVWAHLPTARRLSRCFLECFQGYCAVVTSSGGDFSGFLDELEYSTLQLVAANMVDQESLLVDQEREINGETFLSGNALEMLAIVVARRLSINEGGTDAATLKCIGTFVTIVQKVNNQDASWRSRYSAAVSIETSQILNPRMDVPGKYRQTLLFQVLGMLQDSDPDVRASAGRAAGCLLQSFQAVSYTLLPELMLDKAYGHVFDFGDRDRQRDVAEALVNTLIHNCIAIIDTMNHVEEEFTQTSKEPASASALINATTNRKIFEEGDYNPYQERVLINQLICRALIGMDDTKGATAVYNNLLSVCHGALCILLENQGRGGMAHDMTRFPTIFPALHGLLLGATIALYFGADDTSGVRTAARSLVASSGCIFFHPNVLLTLQCLGEAKVADPATKAALVSNLFLLKKKNWQNKQVIAVVGA